MYKPNSCAEGRFPDRKELILAAVFMVSAYWDEFYLGFIGNKENAFYKELKAWEIVQN